VFLFRVSKEGTGGCSIAVSQFSGKGIGMVNNYVKRSISALHEIKRRLCIDPMKVKDKTNRINGDKTVVYSGLN
jgi:hypothetical protein